MTERADPDRLLAAIQRADPKRGRLRLYLGAAAGVGKTFAMLEAAQATRKKGVDVVLGVVVTHGRAETEARLPGLPRLALRRVEHKGLVVEELDLDAALARRPGVLVVDELAHTNAPGSRHAKRYEDVLELLDAGIDVWTALNVQHLESLNDVVSDLTGVRVRETVPDSVLDRADEIEVVDVPPAELLERLRTGRIYAEEQAARALRNFFVPSNLVALRELALRRAVEHVGAEAESLREQEHAGAAWSPSLRVMVAVTSAPRSGRLVRTAARLARASDAPWWGVTVQPLGTGDPARHAVALEHLRLAEHLGAETEVLHGDDVPATLLEAARRRNVNLLVVGAPGPTPWADLVRGSVLRRLIRHAGDLDVHVVPARADEVEAGRALAERMPVPERRVQWGALLLAPVAVAATTGLAELAGAYVVTADVAMLYVLAITLVAFRASRAAALLAAALSIAAFDLFFVPPTWTFRVEDTRYVTTFLVLFTVGAITSGLAARARQRLDAAREGERRTRALYGLARRLAATTSPAELAAVAAGVIHEEFGHDVSVRLDDGHGPEEVAAAGRPLDGLDEGPTATWAFDHAQPAGSGTATLPGTEGTWLPLVGRQGVLGVLGIRSGKALLDDPDDRHLLETCLAQLAGALERTRLEEEARHAAVAADTERTRSALLSSVSHDLRTPLAAIQGAATSLLDPEAALADTSRHALLEDIVAEAERLSRLLTNLLELTRVESGALALNGDWHLVEDVVGAALAHTSRALAGREVRVRVTTGDALVWMDPLLVELVLVNLLENAGRYAPEGPIDVGAEPWDGGVRLVVADRGPGPPGDDPSQVFRKFWRAPGAGGGGAGLGLAIVDAAARVHGGWVAAEPREGGGARFVVWLPRGGPRALEAPDALEAADG